MKNVLAEYNRTIVAHYERIVYLVINRKPGLRRNTNDTLSSDYKFTGKIHKYTIFLVVKRWHSCDTN